MMTSASAAYVRRSVRYQKSGSWEPISTSRPATNIPSILNKLKRRRKNKATKIGARAASPPSPMPMLISKAHTIRIMKRKRGKLSNSGPKIISVPLKIIPIFRLLICNLIILRWHPSLMKYRISYSADEESWNADRKWITTFLCAIDLSKIIQTTIKNVPFPAHYPKIMLEPSKINWLFPIHPARFLPSLQPWKIKPHD